ncbi:hypothetical protein CEXT_683211 [Caerostris extrusa]|uniref:Uncharacterized protein n=1 Tax=Caerostris extrusa TaxID=172846 RepID=A0AAV4V7Z5_CAEEX|nr:hypothetical protein CEXT_683211 [Caerostris extrusa]
MHRIYVIAIDYHPDAPDRNSKIPSLRSLHSHCPLTVHHELRYKYVVEKKIFCACYLDFLFSSHTIKTCIKFFTVPHLNVLTQCSFPTYIVRIRSTKLLNLSPHRFILHN